MNLVGFLFTYQLYRSTFVIHGCCVFCWIKDVRLQRKKCFEWKNVTLFGLEHSCFVLLVEAVMCPGADYDDPSACPLVRRIHTWWRSTYR